MGYYNQAPRDPEPQGCVDALMLTRAVFGILLWPLLLLFGAITGIGVIFYCFSVHLWLGLLVLIFVGASLVGLGRWQQQRSRGLDEF